MGCPLVSIILPVYNGERFLDEALRSCLDQTLSDWEMIVVDDASTDDSAKIISRYCVLDARIKSVRHERNRKLPAALNTGFGQATGNYLTWLSDDNRFWPEALAEMASFLNNNPDIGVVYSDYRRIDLDGRMLREKQVKDPDKLVFGNVVGASFLYRRQVHQEVGDFDESKFLVEDYDFWLRCSKKFRLAPLHVVLYDYRMHSGSLTERRKREIRQAHLELLWEHLPSMGWVGRKKLAEGYLYLAEEEIDRGRLLLGWKGWLKATCAAPGRGMGSLPRLSKRILQSAATSTDRGRMK